MFVCCVFFLDMLMMEVNIYTQYFILHSYFRVKYRGVPIYF